MEPRIPPKFVPTLTEVVAFDEGAEGSQSEAGPDTESLPQDELLTQTRTTSTGWADLGDDLPAHKAGGDLPPEIQPEMSQEVTKAPAMHLPAGFEDEMAQRVLQRVQVALQAQLEEAIEGLVRQHTQAMLAPLSEKIEAVVRDSVMDAVQQELKACQPATGR